MNPTGQPTAPENSPDKTTGAAGKRTRGSKFFWLVPALLTLLSYLPLLKNGFVDWDDDVFILHNYHIKCINPDSLRWMFTNFYAGFLMPVYWLFLALEYLLGGVEPRLYHLDSLLLHCLNTVLVFHLSFKILALAAQAKRLGNGNPKASLPLAALVTALLFGIHPVHVESVAWAAEQKDLLCGTFFLSGLLVYLFYAAGQVRKAWAYGVCLGLFTLALFSKPMAVSFPFVLMLLDFWPLARYRRESARLFYGKIPFFLIALFAAGSVVAYQYRSGQTIGFGVLPLDFRVMNSLHSLVFYLLKMLCPASLAAFYPIFLGRCFSTGYLVSALLVSAVSLACFIYRKERPYLLAAWLYYVITLIPVLGLVQANSVAAADRYTYLPCLGPFLLLATVALNLLSRWRFAAFLLITGVAALLGPGTFQQVSVWRDSVSLWENALKVNPVNNPIVYTNLAYSYQEAGRLDDALRWYERAISTGVPQPNPLCGKGEVLMEKGFLDEAIQEFRAAEALNPAYAQPHYDLAKVYERQGLLAEALKEGTETVHLQPDFAQAYEVLGEIYSRLARYDEAFQAFKTAYSLDPDNRSYFNELDSISPKTDKPRVNPVP